MLRGFSELSKRTGIALIIVSVWQIWALLQLIKWLYNSNLRILWIFRNFELSIFMFGWTLIKWDFRARLRRFFLRDSWLVKSSLHTNHLDVFNKGIATIFPVNQWLNNASLWFIKTLWQLVRVSVPQEAFLLHRSLLDQPLERWVEVLCLWHLLSCVSILEHVLQKLQIGLWTFFSSSCSAGLTLFKLSCRLTLNFLLRVGVSGLVLVLFLWNLGASWFHTWT